MSAHVTLDRFSPEAREALRTLGDVVGPRPCFLVGGAVRDALAGRGSPDLDVAVPGGAMDVGRALAERTGGAFVVLDEVRGVCRVAGPVQIDLADFRAAGLAADLRARDFTVNALAVPVADLLDSGRAVIEDPTGGVRDLAVRRIRACSPAAFHDDPVRALRAARLASEPGWTLDRSLEPAIRAAAPALVRVSAERVRDELIAILAAPGAGAAIRMLDRLDVLAVILPESLAMRRTAQPAPHRFDVWEHSLRALEAMAELEAGLHRLDPWGPELRIHLAEDLGDGLTRAAALMLAALLHDISKPETRARVGDRIRFFGHDHLGAERARAVGSRLRLSRRATEVVGRLVDQHLRPMHLARSGAITRRARYRFFRDLGPDARDLLLLTLADAAAVAGDSPIAVWSAPGGAIVRSLMEGMAEEALAATTPPLLRGEDVMGTFGLDPGPEVGRLLARAREAQAMGSVSTRDDALAFLRRLLDTPGDAPLE